MWKRENARLTYEWDVDTFDDTEPDRPQFYGTKTKPVSLIQGKTDHNSMGLKLNQ